MNEPGSASFLLNRRFGEFDACVEALRGWKLDLRQLDRGAASLEVFQAVRDGIQLGHARFNRRYEQRVAVPPGLLSFALLEESTREARWNYQPVDGCNLVCFPSGDEIAAVSSPDFAVCTLTLPEALLAEHAAALGYPEPPPTLGREPRVLRLPRETIDRLRSGLAGLCRTLAADPSCLDEPGLGQLLGREFPEQLAAAIAPPQTVPVVPGRKSRQRALERVAEYFREGAGPAPGVGDLCRAARVTERTLEYAFREHFGVPPRTYLKARRLHGARRDLRSADPAITTVAAVAERWGFWHLSQFAADYRGLFGETPSTTLRRR